MSLSSQDQSFQLFSCKWAWCRSTFPNNAGLVHHVVHDHVRRAIPVRRRDISMIQRAEEGKGESLRILELMVEYSSRESISHKSVEHQEPSSSLPSPPASSPALHSPHLPEPASSPSPLPLERRGQRNPDNVSRQTSSKPLQGQTPPANEITSFASLFSPEPERPPFSFEIPDSPSFSSLLERPKKLKKISNSGHSLSRNKIHANQPHPPPLSHPSSVSFGSQNSVEAQLTQTQDDDDVAQDEDLDLEYHSSDGLSQAADIPMPCFESIHEHDEPPEYVTSNLQSQSHNHHYLESLPVTSQPPSQLRDSEFPLHFHDHPRGSTSKAHLTVHTGLYPTAAVPLSPLSPALSPIFAVSTPVRQNWYQPPLKRRKKSTCNDKSSDSSPSKAEGTQTKSKKRIREGTFQIAPASLSEESNTKHAEVDALPMDIDSDANRQNDLSTHPHSPCDLEIFSQSFQDSSDLSQINSYPALQTQAPYQSQILTQF